MTAATAAVLADEAFPRLKSLVIEATGMAFYQDKNKDLAQIVAARMAEIGVPDCAQYAALLSSESDEMDALVAELTIGETYFFRHREQFDALRDLILPEVIERNRPFKRLRIWSAGCATGPEPYSIAILLEREFGAQIADWRVSVLGTDINRKFLDRASQGVYDSWAFRAMDEGLRDACFAKLGNQWRIDERYKRVVSFRPHNLITEPFPDPSIDVAAFDIIICRNVIIYFSPETIAGLIPRFRESLNEGGWLIMGHAEPNQHLFRDFRTVNAEGAILYQRARQSEVANARVSVPPPPPAAPSATPSAALSRLSALGTGEPLPPALPPRKLAVKPKPPQPAAPPTPASTSELDDVRRLANRGQWAEAAAACDALLRATPLNPWAHFYRALIHEQSGEAEAVEKALRRAIYLDRRLVLPHYHLGLLLARRGEAAAAGRAFRNAEALARDLPDDYPAAVGEAITVGQMRDAIHMQLDLIGGET